jgi:hypothetical protein
VLGPGDALELLLEFAADVQDLAGGHERLAVAHAASPLASAISRSTCSPLSSREEKSATVTMSISR